jgi:hypothetical protein
MDFNRKNNMKLGKKIPAYNPDQQRNLIEPLILTVLFIFIVILVLGLIKL